jgi:hypothetical protein
LHALMWLCKVAVRVSHPKSFEAQTVPASDIALTSEPVRRGTNSDDEKMYYIRNLGGSITILQCVQVEKVYDDSIHHDCPMTKRQMHIRECPLRASVECPTPAPVHW